MPELTTRSWNCGNAEFVTSHSEKVNCTFTIEKEENDEILPTVSTIQKLPMPVHQPFSGHGKREIVDNWLEHETVTFRPVIRNAFIDP